MEIRNNEITPGSLVDIPLIKLDRIGFNPKNRSFYKNVHNNITAFVAAATFIIQLLSCVTRNYDSVGNLLLDILTTSALYQVMYRTIICIKNEQIYCELIDIVKKKFWSADFLDDKEYQTIQNMYRFLIKLAKCYYITTYIAANGFFLSKMVEKSIPASLWPEHLDKLAYSNMYYFIIIWIYQSVFIGTGIYSIIQHDILLYIFVCITLIEINKLKYKFTAIGTGKFKEDNYDILRDCIHHHCLLLKFLDDIENVYSPILLHVLATTMCGTAVAVFGVLLDVELSKKLGFSALAVCLPVQLFIYCLLGQFVQDETESVATTVYYCNWENITDLRIRKALTLVIRRCQAPVNITMGGLLILSLETFKQVANMVFSVVTLFLQTRETTN